MSDVIIVGGGPAGSVLGSYLAKAGISTTIFESLNHPRPHVGNSLVTSTMPVMEEIGVLETIPRNRVSSPSMARRGMRRAAARRRSGSGSSMRMGSTSIIPFMWTAASSTYCC